MDFFLEVVSLWKGLKSNSCDSKLVKIVKDFKGGAEEIAQ